MNIEQKKSLTVPQWKQMAESHMYDTPSIGESGLIKRKRITSDDRTSQDLKKKTKGMVQLVLPNSESSSLSSSSSPDQIQEIRRSMKVLSDYSGKRASQSQPKKMEPLVLPLISYPVSSKLSGETYLPKPRTFTLEELSKLEINYWKNITYIPPLYGADTPGSIFRPNVSYWNVTRLDNLLNKMKVALPGFTHLLISLLNFCIDLGVNTSYLYFGMWKSTFGWHLEDMNLYSINYIHYGAPKQWYAIPQSQRLKFERIARETYPSESAHCSEFLRHKTFVFSERFLRNVQIDVLKCVQSAGEFIITFPLGYHSGIFISNRL